MSEKDTRLIEHDIPLKEISEKSVIEKSTRHGNLSTVHAWWARKPIVASRAAIYASLIPKPKNPEELDYQIDFIKRIADYDNTKNEDLINKARKQILDAFNGKRPVVLDPLSGGGSIPLEAFRLGCYTYSLEYNPVAVFLQKAYIENLLKFPTSYSHLEKSQKTLDIVDYTKQNTERNLLKDFKKWAEWVEKEARKELKKFYYRRKEEEPIGYYWMRAVPCQRPDCNAFIPLTTNFWLAKFSKKDRRDIALKPKIKDGEVEFEIVRGNKIDFDPKKGTCSNATATCSVCNSTIDQETFRKLYQEGEVREKLVTVLTQNPNTVGKGYRIATKEDIELFERAKEFLSTKIENQKSNLGFSPLPKENLPEIGTLGFRVQRYGLKEWKDLFNPRQQLSKLTFLEKTREVFQQLKEEEGEKYAKVIVSLLSILIDRMADYNSSLCVLNYTGGRGTTNTLKRTALPMRWDYIETNPFNPIGANWEAGIIAIEKAFEKTLVTKSKGNKFEVEQGNVASLPYDNETFDLIVTDPPYYDNIPYAALSDFFYVWLKRSVGNIYPDLFSTPLTPKGQEIVEEPARFDGDDEAAKEFFEDSLTKSFKEINRVLKRDGLLTIIFAHKSTEAWETLISTLLNSNFCITASWPVQTEKAGRLRAQKSAVLKSSVYFVCRKSEQREEAYFEDIEEDIKERIEDRLDYFWKTGTRGADFFVSAIGPAVEVFGKYKKVKYYSGETVDVSELLEFTENYVAQYALRRILKSPPSKLDPITRFYLVWRWAYKNEKIPFDVARLLAQALGLEITDYTGKEGLIQKSKGKIKIPNPKERGNQFIEKPLKNPTMIDVLHKAAIFWKNGNKKKLNKILQENNYVEDEHFWKVIQAISEVLPKGNPEKKMLQGLLAGRDSLEKAPKLSKITDFAKGV